MARQWFIPGCGVIEEDGTEEYFVPGCGVLTEDQVSFVPYPNPRYALAAGAQPMGGGM